MLIDLVYDVKLIETYWIKRIIFVNKTKNKDIEKLAKSSTHMKVLVFSVRINSC